MTAPTVVMHRPPLKRIDIGARHTTHAADPYAGYEVDRTAETEEHDRVWKLLRQSAEGCNQVGEGQ